MMKYEIIGKRNPRIILFAEDTTKFIIQTVGDPHLGRNYRNNLRSRLGDREDSIKQEFISLLNNRSNLVSIMGDLFDKVVVTNEWLSFTINAITDAAVNNPYTTYVILNGNHDEVKDKSRVSSFRLLEKYFESLELENIVFVSDGIFNVPLGQYNTQLCFTNYDSFKTLDESVSIEDLELKENTTKIAFGHFEVESFGSDKFINREVPNILLDNFDLIVSGHIHKPYNHTISNTPILVTGSMQPYSFGEEIKDDGLLYITINNEELKNILNKDPDYFINSNVKILYNRDEELVGDFNAYSISFKLNQESINKEEFKLTDTDVLSFSSLFLQALSNNTTEENEMFSKELESIFLEKSY